MKFYDSRPIGIFHGMPKGLHDLISFPPQFQLTLKLNVIMRINFVLILTVAALFEVSATGFGQNKITLSKSNASIIEIFKEIQSQSDCDFIYSNRMMVNAKKVTIRVKDALLSEVLQKCFENQPFTYSVENKTIIVKEIAPSGRPQNETPPTEDMAISISGRVTDEHQAPMQGVSITVKGSTVAATTNSEGNFLITIPGSTATVVFSYVGYEPQEVKVAESKSVNIILRIKSAALNDVVVVVGYGSQKQRKITSAISEVNTSGLKDLPIATPGQLLQGRVSGVSVTEDNGAPGVAPSIQIHGISSINAGISPLVVVDGFPVGNEIPASLNPNDIENMTVLKDAASTSIFGARGSNGVILIQTVKAKKTQSDLSYNVSAGQQFVPKSWRPKVLDAYQYAQYNKERVEETNAFSHTNTAVPQVFLDVLNDPAKYGKGTDWLDAFLQEGSDAPFQNHNLSFRAGSDKFRAAVSGGYLNQQGVLPNSGFKRYSLRTNLEGNVTKWLTIGANAAVARTERNAIPVPGMWGTVMESVVASPLQSPFDANGKLVPYLPADAPGYFSFANPLYTASVEKDQTIGRDVNAGVNLDMQIIKGLHYKTQVYTRLFTQQENTFIPTTIGQPVIGAAGNLALGAPPFVNSATNRNLDLTNWGIDNLLTYETSAGRHSFGGLLGYTAQKETGALSQINASNFPTDNNLNYLEASEVTASVTDYSNWSLAALFGRLNYDYDGKYLAEVDFRREGSSRFGSNNKYGNFPSASVGWRVSQEEFFPKKSFMNELKLRASYGKTGNSAIGDFDRFGTIISIPDLSNVANNYNYVLANTIVTGKSLTSLGDPNLKWETSKQLDIGLTTGLFNDRITFKVDYFRKVTNNMLFNVSLPLVSGFAFTRINAGQMLNKGWDFELGASAGTKEFTWSTNLNVSLLQNTVTYIPPEIKKIVSTYNVTEVGHPVGSLYGYIVEGTFNTQQQVDDPKLIGWPGAKSLGAFIYKDVNGDGKIDALDQDIIGNPHPKAVLGFNNVFAYRNFTLSILTTGAFGYQILPEKNEWLYNEKGRWNVSNQFLNRWKSTDNIGNGVIPAIYYPGQHSDTQEWVENGDHLWVKNITLGYKIPPMVLNRLRYISGIRVYVSVQNALRFTNYTGWNPEVSTLGGSNPQTLGIDNFSYPLARTFTVGANINL